MTCLSVLLAIRWCLINQRIEYDGGFLYDFRIQEFRGQFLPEEYRPTLCMRLAVSVVQNAAN